MPSARPTKSSLGQEAGDAGRDEVDGDAGHDVVDAEGDGGQREQQPAERPADGAADERRPRTPVPAGPTGEPGAEDHHALEADVHDADPLGEQAAEPGEEDRRHGAPMAAMNVAPAVRSSASAMMRHEREHGEPDRRRSRMGRTSGRAVVEAARQRSERGALASGSGSSAVMTPPLPPARCGRAQRPCAGRRPGRPRRRVAPHDLEGDDGGQQQRPLQDLADLLGHADRRKAARRPLDRRPTRTRRRRCRRGGCARAGRPRCR